MQTANQNDSVSVPSYLNVQQIGRSLSVLMLVPALYQIIEFQDVQFNLVCTLWIYTISLLARTVCLNGQLFSRSPFQSLMVLAFDFTSLSGPLVLRSISFEPVAGNLRLPLQTFLLAGFTALIICAVLVVYSGMHIKRVLLSEGFKPFFVRAGLFEPLNASQLLVLFVFGLLMNFALKATSSIALAKIGDSFSVLFLAPILIYCSNLFSTSDTRPRPVGWTTLTVYMAFSALLGIIYNSREILISALVVLAIAYALKFRNPQTQTIERHPLQWLALAILVTLGFLFYERLAQAMVAVRGFRGTVGVGEMLSLTAQAFLDSEYLSTYSFTDERVDDAFSDTYGQSYVQSRLLSRFVLTKHQDSLLYWGSMLGPEDLAELWHYRLIQLLSILPQPVLQFFAPEMVKDSSYSIADIAVNMVAGAELGGQRTGSLFIDTWFAVGWYFPIAMIGIAFLLFAIVDFLSISKGMGLFFSPLLILMSWKLLGTLGAYGFGADSLIAFISFVIRTFPQTLLMYLLSIAIVRALVKNPAP